MTKWIEGVGPDAPTVTNKKGGKQSELSFRCDLIPAGALAKAAKAFEEGAKKYGKDNWRLLPRTDNLNHAAAHIFAYFAGDDTDDHLTHAACRILMALETTDDESPD